MGVYFHSLCKNPQMVSHSRMVGKTVIICLRPVGRGRAADYITVKIQIDFYIYLF